MKKVEDPEEIRQAFREKHKHSLYDFAWDALNYTAMHPPLHRDLVCEFLTNWKEGMNTKLLLIPREHLKTTLATISFPMWAWTLDPDDDSYNFPHGPDTRIFLSHALRKIAVDFIREHKEHLTDNEALRWLYPEICYENPDKDAKLWQQDQFVIPRPGISRVASLSATGCGASKTGNHYDIMIYDDLVDDKNVKTQEMRDAVEEYFQYSLAMLRKGGRVLVIGTRWHKDDFYGRLLDPDGKYGGSVDSLVLKSGYSEGKPIFPVSKNVPQCGFDMERLEEKLKLMTHYPFYSQFENDPQQSGESSFNRNDLDLARFRLDFDGEVPTHKALWFFTAIDPNRSRDTMNDPCAIVTGAFDEDGDLWIVDITRGHPNIAQIVEWSRVHVKRWDSRALIIETTGFQNQLLEEFQKDMVNNNYRVKLIEAKRGPTSKKTDRIRTLLPFTERQGLHILLGSMGDMLVDELVGLEMVRNDDIADATADIRLYGERPPKARKKKKKAPNSPFMLKNILGDVENTGIARRKYS